MATDRFYTATDEKLNEICFNTLLERWKLKAISRFHWEGLPSAIEERKIENYLFDEGKCIFVKDELRGYLVLRCQAINYYDINYRPTQASAVGFGYIKTYNIYWGEDGYKSLVDADGKKVYDEYNTGIIISNNYLGLSTYEQIIYKIYQLYNVERALDTNVSQLSLNNILVAGMEDSKNVQMLINNLKKHKAFNAISTKSLLNEIKTLELNPVYYGNQLESLKRSLESDLDVWLGFNNVGMEKKERLITDEVNANNESIESELDNSMTQRRYASDLINEFFGLNISPTCSIQKEQEVDYEQGGKNNGNI